MISSAFLMCSSDAQAGDDASFVSWSASSYDVFAGQTYEVNITMKNTGTSAWTADGGYVLGSQNPAGNYVWGLRQVNLSQEDSIAPGKSKTFTFKVTAPANPGTYSFQWQMYKMNSGFFGQQTKNAAIEVKQTYNAYMQQDHHQFKGVGWDIYRAVSPQEVEYLDETTPQFVRHIWWIEFYQPEQNVKTYDSEMAAALYTFLQHAKEKNITILLSNPNGGGYFDDFYNWPPDPKPVYYPNHYFWLSEICHNDPTNSLNRFCYETFSPDPGICSAGGGSGPETDHPYNNDVFAQVLADNLDYIINNKSGRVDYVSLWNEPSGDWAYHPRDASKKYPYSFDGIYKSAYLKFKEKGLLDQVQIAGSDDAFPTKAILDYAVSRWDPAVGGWSLHNYDNPVGSGGTVKYLFDRAGGKPILLGEIGHKGIDGCEDGGEDKWGNSIETTRLMISDIRFGAYAAARWWFGEGIPPKCWDTLSGDGIVPENYNSLKILANTLPQINENISVVWTDFGDTRKNFDAVVINAAPAGQEKKPVLWAVNKNPYDVVFGLTFVGLNKSMNLSTKYVTGVPPYSIVDGKTYSLSADDSFIVFTVPANSIYVAVGEAAPEDKPKKPPKISVSPKEPKDSAVGPGDVSFSAIVLGSSQTYKCLLSLNGNKQVSTLMEVANNSDAVFNVAGLKEGAWSWRVYCGLDASVYNASEARTYLVSSEAVQEEPSMSVSLNSPEDGAVGQSYVSFSATVLGNSPMYKCMMSVNGKNYESTMKDVANNSDYVYNVPNLPTGTWSWKVYCGLNTSVYNQSETRTYIVA